MQERAEREIILCAGAIGSPQLLMLSGVGPADHLREFNVPITCDLPGVGKNLQDHPACAIAYECTKPVSLASAETFSNLMRYMISKQGPLTSNVAEAGAFVKTSFALPGPGPAISFWRRLFCGARISADQRTRIHLRANASASVQPGRYPLALQQSAGRSLHPRQLLADSRDMDVMLEGSSYRARWRRRRPSTNTVEPNCIPARRQKTMPQCARTSPSLLRRCITPWAHARWA